MVHKITLTNNLQSSAAKLSNFLKDAATNLPKYLPTVYKNIKHLKDENDITTFHVEYFPGYPIRDKVVHIQSLDARNLECIYIIQCAELEKYYKNITVTATVTQKTAGCEVVRTYEFEKEDDIKVAPAYFDFEISILLTLDAILAKDGKISGN